MTLAMQHKTPDLMFWFDVPLLHFFLCLLFVAPPQHVQASGMASYSCQRMAFLNSRNLFSAITKSSALLRHTPDPALKENVVNGADGHLKQSAVRSWVQRC